MVENEKVLGRRCTASKKQHTRNFIQAIEFFSSVSDRHSIQSAQNVAPDIWGTALNRSRDKVVEGGIAEITAHAYKSQRVLVCYSCQ